MEQISTSDLGVFIHLNGRLRASSSGRTLSQRRSHESEQRREIQEVYLIQFCILHWRDGKEPAVFAVVETKAIE